MADGNRIAKLNIKFKRRVSLGAGEDNVAGIGDVFNVVEHGKKKETVAVGKANVEKFEISEVLATRFVANETAEITEDKPGRAPVAKKSTKARE